jgi:hypothetical protein
MQYRVAGVLLLLGLALFGLTWLHRRGRRIDTADPAR